MIERDIGHFRETLQWFDHIWLSSDKAPLYRDVITVQESIITTQAV
jgi:hypothetical protein